MLTNSRQLLNGSPNFELSDANVSDYEFQVFPGVLGGFQWSCKRDSDGFQNVTECFRGLSIKLQGGLLGSMRCFKGVWVRFPGVSGN